MIRPGLVSVTYRQLKPFEIVELAADCGLGGIEWGGDVHVTNPREAKSVRDLTESRGLSVAAYGSYWRTRGEFEPVLEIAIELGAPTIRVWAGDKGSAEELDRRGVTDRLRKAVEIASSAGITVSLEFHDGTLTDTLASSLQIAKELDHPALRFYWQPHPRRGLGERRHEVESLLPSLSNVHVFQWTRDPTQRTIRHPLSFGEEEWLAVLPLLDGDRYALLEFVPDDDPALLSQEASTLIGWLKRFSEVRE